MKMMGIDYGSKRVGIAVSTDDGTMAFPLAVLPKNEDFFSALVHLIGENKIEEIVLGQSHNKEGKPNAIQEEINELITDLTLEVGLPVHVEPEIYTTQEALRFQGRTDMTDASAAAIILNSFITRSK
jgi:putative Holliday junction resolvase